MANHTRRAARLVWFVVSYGWLVVGFGFLSPVSITDNTDK